jgi:hypothetical protein
MTLSLSIVILMMNLLLGGNRIHPMNVSTSEVNTAPLPIWTTVRNCKKPYMEELEINTQNVEYSSYVFHMFGFLVM